MNDAIYIGTRREVFWDNYLTDPALSTAETRLCPIENCKTVAEIKDSVVSYLTVCKADDEFRLYYIGGSMEETSDPAKPYIWHLGVNVMTSPNGTDWQAPKVRGRDDNVVIERILDHIFVFRDENPSCPPDELS